MMNPSTHLYIHKKFEYILGKYCITCKVGDYCHFGNTQQSNNLHSHASYELCLILEGEGSFVSDPFSHTLHAGDIILANPHTYHEITCSNYEELTLLYLFLEIKTLSSASPISDEEKIIEYFLNTHTLYASRTQKVFEYFSFIQTYCQHTSCFDYGLHQLFKLLILESLYQLSSKKSTNLPITLSLSPLESALDYIDSHLHQKIYIEDISTYCNVSIRTLQYLFRKELDVSIIEYINHHKIKLACHYLLNNFSILDTSLLIGITDISHFNKLFKNLTGFTPKQVQKIGLPINHLGRRL